MGATYKWWLHLPVLAAVLSSSVNSAPAETRTVTSHADAGPGSLRQVVAEAEAGDTIDFAIFGEIALTTGQLSLDRDIVLSGPGRSQLGISAGTASRILTIPSGVVAELSGLSFSQGGSDDCCGGAIHNAGTLTLRDCAISGSTAEFGGGIFNSHGTLNLVGTTVSQNRGTFGGGIYNLAGGLSLQNTLLSENTASRGGGLFNNGGVLIGSFVGVQSNVADGTDGGGVFNSGTISLQNSILNENSAKRDGGAILNEGDLRLTDSEIQLNQATRDGAGIASSGTLDLAVVEVLSNTAGADGGGLRLNSGAAVIVACTFGENEADRGGGLFSTDSTLDLVTTEVALNSARVGGALFQDGAAKLSMRRGIMSRNTATIAGGALFAVGGEVTLAELSVDDNKVDAGGPNPYGGGIVNADAAVMSILRSTVSRNRVIAGASGTEPRAGGIFNSGTLEIHSSTISSNSIASLFRSTSATGGGIHNVGTNATLSLSDSTVTANAVTAGIPFQGTAGGINNELGTVNLVRSIVAGNIATGGLNDCRNTDGTFISGGYNLVGLLQTCPITEGQGDQRVIDPLLGPLEDNGGPTETHAPQPGSSAIDTGADTCPPVDQRGFVRPTDGDGDFTAVCDIGAVEAFSIAATPTPTGTATPTRTSTATPTPSPSSSPTNSPTRTATPTPTPTPSETPSATPTATDTPSASPTYTATATATTTATPSATVAQTVTPSPTESARPSETGTPTSTLTATPEETPTTSPPATTSATQSPTASGTHTPTPSPLGTATSTLNPTLVACTGNCDADSAVTVAELILGVQIALGHLPVAVCRAFDSNDDNSVAIDELTGAVSNALYGCGVIPPTRTRTSTPTRTRTQVPTASRTGTRTATRTPTRTVTRTPTRPPATVTRTVTRTATRAATGTRTQTPRQGTQEARIRQLLGDWTFTWRIIDLFTNRMRLDTYDPSFAVTGNDLDTGAGVAFSFTTTSREEFIGINITSSYCFSYLFDLTGADRVTGSTFVSLSSDCTAIEGGPFTMGGVRTRRLVAGLTAGQPPANPEEARARLRRVLDEAGSGASLPAGVADDVRRLAQRVKR